MNENFRGRARYDIMRNLMRKTFSGIVIFKTKKKKRKKRHRMSQANDEAMMEKVVRSKLCHFNNLVVSSFTVDCKTSFLIISHHSISAIITFVRSMENTNFVTHKIVAQSTKHYCYYYIVAHYH